MNKKLLCELSSYLEELKSQYSAQHFRLTQIAEYANSRLKINRHTNGIDYYAVLKPGNNNYQYIGPDSNDEVQLIKEAHYLKLSTKDIKHEIDIISKLINSGFSTTYEDVNAKLSKAYRYASIMSSSKKESRALAWKSEMEKFKSTIPVYREHELIHKTNNGTYVRSKSEALIYNYLLSLDVTFVYELPLRINSPNKNGLLLPDFTLLSETDFNSVIYIEHQGMMSSSDYRDKFHNSIYKYWSNNIIPERDVFFTFDLPNGGFDDTPIKHIVRSYIKT